MIQPRLFPVNSPRKKIFSRVGLALAWEIGAKFPALAPLGWQLYCHPWCNSITQRWRYNCRPDGLAAAGSGFRAACGNRRLPILLLVCTPHMMDGDIPPCLVSHSRYAAQRAEITAIGGLGCRAFNC